MNDTTLAKRLDNAWLDLRWFIRVSLRCKIERIWPFKSRADREFEKAFWRAVGGKETNTDAN
jgi:hypothetical protein